MNRLDGLNRAVLTIVALLLGAAGVYGLVRGADGFGEDAATEPLLWADLRRFVDDNGWWFWPAVAVGALLVAYLAWRWLRVQLLPTPSLDELPVERGEDGVTRLEAGAIADAVRRELESHPHVSTARARLVGEPDEPVLDLRATVVDGGDSDGVRRWVEENLLPDARAALEAPALTATLRLRLGEASKRIVA